MGFNAQDEAAVWSREAPRTSYIVHRKSQIALRLIKRTIEELLGVGEVHHLLEGAVGVVFHIGGHDVPADEGAEATGRGVAEVAGEGGLFHEPADDIIVLGVEHILFDEVLPDLFLELGGPLVFFLRVADEVLGRGFGEHRGGEEDFLPLEDHIVEPCDGRFLGQMLVSQSFGETVEGDELAFAAFSDEFGHTGGSIVFEILAQVHIDAEEEIVAIAEDGGGAEVHSRDKGVEGGDGVVGKMGEVDFEGFVESVGDVVHRGVLFLDLLIEGFDGGVVEVALEPVDHLLVFPAVFADEVFGVLAVQSGDAIGQMIDIQGEKILFVAFESDRDLFGLGLLLLGQLRGGHLLFFVAGGQCYSASKQNKKQFFHTTEFGRQKYKKWAREKR